MPYKKSTRRTDTSDAPEPAMSQADPSVTDFVGEPPQGSAPAEPAEVSSAPSSDVDQSPASDYSPRPRRHFGHDRYHENDEQPPR